jgi:hypothetical protein
MYVVIPKCEYESATCAGVEGGSFPQVDACLWGAHGGNITTREGERIVSIWDAPSGEMPPVHMAPPGHPPPISYKPIFTFAPSRHKG